MNDLLKLAIEGHGGLPRWEQVSWFRVAVSITGAIWALNGKHGLLDGAKRQTYYFDDAGLLRRLDYSVDILGGGPAVHTPAEYQEFDGIMVPTRRRVYVRNPDGSPARDSISIAIDITNVTFS